MEDILTNRPPDFDRLAFIVIAIEASAKEMGIAPWEMRQRHERVGLVKNLLYDCCDTLHTQSRAAVAADVVEALRNWEKSS